MARIELQKADSCTIGEVFWFRENRKSVILLGQLARLFMKHPGQIPFLTGELLSQIGSPRHEVGTTAVFGPTADQ